MAGKGQQQENNPFQKYQNRLPTSTAQLQQQIHISGRPSHNMHHLHRTQAQHNVLFQPDLTHAPIIIEQSRSSQQECKQSAFIGNLNDYPKTQQLPNAKEDLLLLDRFVRLKQEDKPKDTLSYLRAKRREFLNYVNPHSIPLKTEDPPNDQSNIQNSNVSMKKIYQYTISKKIRPNSLLIVRITQSEYSRCNIVVSNEQGDIVKYYPNSMLIKKIEKILKITEEYPLCHYLVIDAHFREQNKQFFQTLFRKGKPIIYRLTALSQQQFNLCLPELTLLQSQNKLQLQCQQNSITIYRSSEHLANYLTIDFQTQIENLFKEQQNFLLGFRNHKSPEQINLSHDLLAVTLWRKYKQSPERVTDKIIKLYCMQEEKIEADNQIPQAQNQHLHLPTKTKKEQNCVLCNAKHPRHKPKRTPYICSLCSQEKQKPLYLCRKCFAQYHANTDIHLFKKNQKRTKKLIKHIQKQTKNNSIHNSDEPQQPVNGLQPPVPDKEENNRRIYGELDQLNNDVFDKIQGLIEEGSEGNLQACEFYLNMYLNMNIQFMRQLPELRAQTASQDRSQRQPESG